MRSLKVAGLHEMLPMLFANILRCLGSAHPLRAVAIYAPNWMLFSFQGEPWRGGTSISLALGKDNWSYSCVRIRKSRKTLCIRRLIFNGHFLSLFSWGTGSGKLKWRYTSSIKKHLAQLENQLRLWSILSKAAVVKATWRSLGKRLLIQSACKHCFPFQSIIPILWHAWLRIPD